MQEEWEDNWKKDSAAGRAAMLSSEVTGKQNDEDMRTPKQHGPVWIGRGDNKGGEEGSVHCGVNTRDKL